MAFGFWLLAVSWLCFGAGLRGFSAGPKVSVWRLFAILSGWVWLPWLLSRVRVGQGGAVSGRLAVSLVRGKGWRWVRTWKLAVAGKSARQRARFSVCLARHGVSRGFAGFEHPGAQLGRGHCNLKLVSNHNWIWRRRLQICLEGPSSRRLRQIEPRPRPRDSQRAASRDSRSIG